VHTRETFSDALAGPALSDRIFDRCEFRNTWVSCPPRPPRFVRAERLDFIDCRVRATRGLSRVECHEILVRGVPKRSARVLASEFLLDRVTFEGDFHAGWSFFWIDAHLDERERDHARTFYASLPSFALDVRDGRFASLTLRGVPGHLVLRDPTVSALVHRDRLESDRSWCKLDAWGRPDAGVSSELDLFLRAEPRWPSCVLVAGTLGEAFQEELAELEALKRAGYAD